ncbi:hypothetical protein KHQ06_16115 [Nocardia tengchongensis]|uniref:Uncharacterized protein n=1 Tax=Nocardia tengchongensis TaxID=2055889 RepID=A0ABX8D170_9NOCA|nr:hypothetical protein [Nocardia tengchongensis]QVI24160.1 hypothetical protein KHQ06_16115 [Nocardia tengchongensis]
MSSHTAHSMLTVLACTPILVHLATVTVAALALADSLRAHRRRRPA